MSGKKTIMITGATRGIGQALARELARRGHRVFGTGRSFAEDPGARPPFTAVAMDVRDEDSVRAAVLRVREEGGGIDVLVNNAGVSHSGPVEETPIGTAREMFETNYLGVVRTIKAVLPFMREQGRGTIAIVGSAAGKIGVPFQAHYAASKFAVEGLAESLYHELAGFGVRVLLFEPGDVRTEIWERSKSPADPESPYFRPLERFLRIKDREMGQSATPPEAVAVQIADVIEADAKRLRRPVARGANFFLLARKLLPDRIFLWAVAKNYKLKQPGGIGSPGR